VYATLRVARAPRRAISGGPPSGGRAAARIQTTTSDGAYAPSLFSARMATKKNYWLMKSEPDECSIDAALAAKNSTVPWTGVRNYQARNFMWREMRVGDGVLFYHSSCAEPGIAGIAAVASTPYPDPTQFNRKSKYFDAAARKDEPRWWMVDVKAIKRTRLVSIAELRDAAPLKDLIVLRRGNRLSITPVSAEHWRYITTELITTEPSTTEPTTTEPHKPKVPSKPSKAAKPGKQGKGA
jgi:predicted RNA-binding protein with PUA-like domain